MKENKGETDFSLLLSIKNACRNKENEIQQFFQRDRELKRTSFSTLATQFLRLIHLLILPFVNYRCKHQPRKTNYKYERNQTLFQHFSTFKICGLKLPELPSQYGNTSVLEVDFTHFTSC